MGKLSCAMPSKRLKTRGKILSWRGKILSWRGKILSWRVKRRLTCRKMHEFESTIVHWNIACRFWQCTTQWLEVLVTVHQVPQVNQISKLWRTNLKVNVVSFLRSRAFSKAFMIKCFFCYTTTFNSFLSLWVCSYRACINLRWTEVSSLQLSTGRRA